jgi:hypothetical protein
MSAQTLSFTFASCAPNRMECDPRAIQGLISTRIDWTGAVDLCQHTHTDISHSRRDCSHLFCSLDAEHLNLLGASYAARRGWIGSPCGSRIASDRVCCLHGTCLDARPGDQIQHEVRHSCNQVAIWMSDRIRISATRCAALAVPASMNSIDPSRGRQPAHRQMSLELGLRACPMSCASLRRILRKQLRILPDIRLSAVLGALRSGRCHEGLTAGYTSFGGVGRLRATPRHSGRWACAVPRYTKVAQDAGKTLASLPPHAEITMRASALPLFLALAIAPLGTSVTERATLVARVRPFQATL